MKDAQRIIFNFRNQLGFVITLFFCISTINYSFGSKGVSEEITDKVIIDSLNKVIANQPHTLEAASAFVTLSDLYYHSRIDTVMFLCEKAIGITNEFSSNNSNSTTKLTQIRAQAFNNIGYVYDNHGQRAKAIESYTNALKLREKIEDKKGMAESLSNIGAFYSNNHNIPQALQFYQRCLLLRAELGDKKGLAKVYNNLGTLFENEGDHKTSLEHFLRSLKIYEALGDEYGISDVCLSLGSVYFNRSDTTNPTQADFTNAKSYYLRSLQLFEKLDDKVNQAQALWSLGYMAYYQGSIADAKKYAQQSMQLAKANQLPLIIMNDARLFYLIYDEEKKYDQALQQHVLYTTLHDSIYNEESTRKAIQTSMNYEFERKQEAMQLDEDKRQALQEAENRKQRVILASISIVLLLVLVLVAVVYRNLKLNQRNTKIITQQKALVEQKHREINDSIYYAERIQRSFLANHELLKQGLQDYFILYRPQAIVSGDFYWATNLSNGGFILVTADSTGHGVPGAIMSLLNISSIEKALERGVSTADELLNQTRTAIIERLKKDGSAEGGRDGMDGSVLWLSPDKRTLSYAGANSPLWIVRSGNLLEFAPDKMPVGKHDKDQLPFTSQSIPLQNGDTIYTFTDGFPDQFGGPQGKKYMYKRLKALVLEVAGRPMSEQNQRFNQAFDDWKGNHDQVDDVTLIGFRV